MLIFGTGVKCDQSSDNMVNNITGYEKRGSSVKLKDISVTSHTYLGITSWPDLEFECTIWQSGKPGAIWENSWAGNTHKIISGYES